MSATFAIAAPSGETTGGSRLKAIAAVIGVLLLAIFMALTFGVGGASAADLQCSGGVGDGGGQGINCQITVVNNVDLNDPTQNSSTVTMTSCSQVGSLDMAAGPILAGDPCPVANYATTTVSSTTLVTDIGQCNYAVNGSGGVVYCSVDVLNQITGTSTAPVAATINECNGASAAGGGGTLNCNGWVDPAIAAPSNVSVTNADVTQCNNSAILVGNVVDCQVATDSTVSAILPITVNQCNNSANSNGAVVVCRTRIRTVIRASIADTSYSTNTATFTPLPTSPANGLAAPREVVVPAIVVVPVTPPTPPVTDNSGNNTSNSGGNTNTGTQNRLVNTGSLASTGTNPVPAGLIALLAILLGVTGVITSKRIGFRKVG